MSDWIGAVTNAGKALLESWAVSGSTLEINAATLGTGTVEPVNLRIQTAVSGEVGSAVIADAAKTEAGVRISVQVGPADQAGYTLRQVGVWARVGSGANTLLALYQNADGIVVPDKTTSPKFVFVLYAGIALSNDGDVVIAQDPNAYVTEGELDEILAEALSAKVDTADFEPIAAGDIPLAVSAEPGPLVTLAEHSAEAPLPAFVLYGKSVQDGTPAPEDPADIATAGSAGNIVLRGTNGNLFNPAYLLGASGWTEQNGVYSGDALALFNRFQAAAWIPDTPAGTPLTISGRAIVPTSIQSPRFVFQYSDGSVQNVNIPTGSSFATFSGTSDPGKIIGRITFTYSSGEGTVSLTDLRISIGAEPVTLDYVAPITVTLPTPNGLPGIPVSSGGNYTDAGGQQWICDTIDKAAGVYTQRVGKVVWDGSSDESWTPQPGWSLPGFTTYVGDSTIQADITKPPNVLCDRLPAIPNNATYGQYDALVAMTNNAPTYQVAIRGYGAEADFRAYLGTHNITMLYPLATPVVTPLTAAQIAALDALRSHEGATVIYTTDAVQPEMAVSFATPIRAYIDNRIDALREAMTAKFALIDDCFDAICEAHNNLVTGTGYRIFYEDGEIIIEVEPNG